MTNSKGFVLRRGEKGEWNRKKKVEIREVVEQRRRNVLFLNQVVNDHTQKSWVEKKNYGSDEKKIDDKNWLQLWGRKILWIFLSHWKGTENLVYDFKIEGNWLIQLFDAETESLWLNNIGNDGKMQNERSYRLFKIVMIISKLQSMMTG